MYLLKIKIKDGHSFKVLAELIQKYVKDGCWTIDKQGMFLTGIDSKTTKGTKMIRVSLPRYNFTKYKCPEEPLKISINMVHLYRMIKPIKKKDNTLVLFIREDDPLKLGIRAYQMNEKKKGITGHVNITMVRPVVHDEPTGYGDPIIITAKEFQQVKQLNKISKTMELTFKGKTVDLFCDKDGVYSKGISLGDTDDTDDEDDEEDEKDGDEEDEYKQTYDSDKILDLVKPASTSNNIQIWSAPDLPLHVSLNAGANGSVDVYIKSREIIEEEEDEKESSNGSDNVTLEV